VELLAKAGWAQVIQWGTHAAYDPEAETIPLIVMINPHEIPQLGEGVTVVEFMDGSTFLLRVPRYERFRESVESVIAHRGHILDVAGNDVILITLIVPQDWYDSHHRGTVVMEWPILTDSGRKRVALLTPIPQLHETLPSLSAEGLVLDHLYDF
jgi:hypothetical protein